MLCRGFGLSFSTEVPIPGALAGGLGGAIDVEISLGDFPRWTCSSEWGPYRVGDADLFDFFVAGVGRYTVVDRRRIVVTPEMGSDPQALSGILIATVLPALFWACGDVVLHASAATRLPGKPGWLLLGPSGAGKSTRLMRAVERGAFAVADDSVRVRLQGGRVRAAGLPGGAFMRRQGREERDWFETPPDRRLPEAEIGAAFVLETAVERRGRLVGTGAVAALLRARHRPRILRLLGTEDKALGALARISGALRTTAIGLPGGVS